MTASAGPEYFASRCALPAEAVQRMEQCAFSYGEKYNSYLVTENDREYFFSSGRRGVVGFNRWGGNMQVVGGLLAEPDDKERLLVELIEHARARRWRLTFFDAGRSDLKLFRDHGFEVTKFGEEPIVVLDETEWKGQSYEWLRRQEKFCQKNGVTFREIDTGAQNEDYATRIAPELDEISREHLAGTVHRREMKFFVGQFDPLSLGRRRLFVAETAARIECFVVLNPCLNGAMWAIEIFRKRGDAVRGVIPYAMLQTMRQLQAESVPFVSLSLVPWLRTNFKVKGASFLVRAVSVFMWHCGDALYDARGMYHFKSRFRPHWREVYVASLPGFGVSSVAAVGMSWGLLKVNPLRVLSHWWRDRVKNSRNSLAEPPWRAERMIRHLRIDGRQADAAQGLEERAQALQCAAADETRS